MRKDNLIIMQSFLSYLDRFNIFDQIFSIDFSPIASNSFSTAKSQHHISYFY
jgi:hypothetical protein